MASSLLIKNCRILKGSTLVSTHIFISNGIIKKLGAIVKASKVIDAQQNIVIPGMIDAHVHFRHPGNEYKEDFYTGSRAAAKGGITTIFDMPNTNPATTTRAALKQKRELARRHCIVNYGLHFGATPDNLEEIRQADVASVKIYMGSSTGTLLVDKLDDLKRIFEVCKKSKKLCMIHAENEACLVKNTEKYRQQYTEGSEPAELHSMIRDSSCAKLAVKDAIKMQKETKAALYVCHTSTKDELRLIKAAKQKGQQIYCEVTPHHLFLDVRTYRKFGTFVKVNPPLRYIEDVLALWKGINDGTVDTIGTDHAPHQPQEKEQDYWHAPSGIPGVETVIPLLLDAVSKGKLSLKRMVELTSENPAVLFGLKRKGKIALGYDADLVIIDTELEERLEEIQSKSKWSPFQKTMLKGWPIVTIINGAIVYYRGQLYNNKGIEVTHGK